MNEEGEPSLCASSACPHGSWGMCVLACAQLAAENHFPSPWPWKSEPHVVPVFLLSFIFQVLTHNCPPGFWTGKGMFSIETRVPAKRKAHENTVFVSYLVNPLLSIWIRNVEVTLQEHFQVLFFFLICVYLKPQVIFEWAWVFKLFTCNLLRKTFEWKWTVYQNKHINSLLNFYCERKSFFC